MNDKTKLGIVIAVIVLVLLTIWFTRGDDSTTPLLDENGNPIIGVEGNTETSGTINTGSTPSGTTTPGSTNSSSGSSSSTRNNGRVVFMVTDAAAKMNDVSEITLKISKVEVHSQASGWITASTTARTFNLLELKAKSQSKLLADVNIKHGIYDQVRLTLDSASVKLKSGATKAATFPSKILTIGTNLVVTGTPSMLRFDFIADDSLHLTTTSDYVFAPVVVTESQSTVNLTIDNAGVVYLAAGEQRDIGTEGMDADGTVKANFKLDKDSRLVIGADGKVKIEVVEKPKGVVVPVD